MSVIDSSYRPRRIHKLLVANRGEIALRVIRAARELGMRSVAVYSDADHDALATRMADEAVHIGPAHATRSYLNVDAVLKAARETGAQAVHPGYGFLSENAAFAQAVSDAGLIFVGPDAETIRKMGDKAAARACAQAAGVPTVPGSAGVVSSLDEALTHAGGMGYPLMIKAAAGGGGRGIRVVQDEAELRAQMPQAQAEAQAAFGYGGVYLERYLPRAHIEVQVLGDGKNAIHLYERECSLQRRRQKVFEEAPSPALDAATRQRLCESAAQLARSVGYRGAGTLEFLYDDSRGAQDFYFIEMNTRIQVEHPITEAVTGVDLVREMLRIADGEPLRWRQQDISLRRGHRMPAQCGGPAAQFRAQPGPRRSAALAGRTGSARGFHAVSGLHGIALLRFAAGQAHCLGRRPWRGVGPAGAGAGRGRAGRRPFHAGAAPRAGAGSRGGGGRLPHELAGSLDAGGAGGAAMSVRYTHGGDEFIFAEISEDMSLESFFKGMAITRALRERAVDGVTEICPANASYQVRYDPDRIAPDALLACCASWRTASTWPTSAWTRASSKSRSTTTTRGRTRR